MRLKYFKSVKEREIVKIYRCTLYKTGRALGIKGKHFSGKILQRREKKKRRRRVRGGSEL